MLRLLIDQDFDHDILRGLLRRIPDLDAVTAHEVGLSTASDTALLDYAAADSRVTLTHDRKTMPRHASEHIAAGEPMFGVFVIPRRLSLAQVIADLEVMVLCSHYDEWKNIVKFLPL